MVLSCVHSSSLRLQVPVPDKMFPSSLKSYGPGRRKDSAIRTLVAETLVLAKTHGCVEKIESELEEELRRESKGQDSDPLSKWRRQGDKALKSKYVLLTVALFCVTDCALVLGELILDLHKVKDTLETSERSILKFKMTLHETYPTYITDVDTDIRDVFDLISRSRIIWHDSSHLQDGYNFTLNNSSTSLSSSSSGNLLAGSAAGDRPRSTTSASTTVRSVVSVRRKRSSGSDVSEETEYIVMYEPVPSPEKRVNNESTVQEGGHHGKGREHHGGHSLEEEIAHALHLTSITLMAILVFETLLKAFCAGLTFFKRKLETFDFFVVIVSFVVDIVFMQILPRFKIQDFVFILAFLLPWRVIRVVNSLVVAVQDHEHFRLKMLYSRKKKIQNSLREAEVKLQLFKAQCCALKRLCLNEGVEESKIEQIVQLDEYVVNRTGKSKCKVKIDNASVILLDKSDFPRMSPRPSLASLLDKRRSIQVDSARDPTKCDKFFKRNGHTLTVDDALHREFKKDSKGKGRKSSFSFSNGPLCSLFGSKDLEAVPEGAMVRRAGSQGQIAESIKRDLLSADGAVKRAGSQNQLCHITVTSELGSVTSPVMQDGVTTAQRFGLRDPTDVGTSTPDGGFVSATAAAAAAADDDTHKNGILLFGSVVETVRDSSRDGHSGSDRSVRDTPAVDKATQIGHTVDGHFHDLVTADSDSVPSDGTMFPLIYSNNSETDQSEPVSESGPSGRAVAQKTESLPVTNAQRVTATISKTEGKTGLGARAQGNGHSETQAEEAKETVFRRMSADATASKPRDGCERLETESDSKALSESFAGSEGRATDSIVNTTDRATASGISPGKGQAKGSPLDCVIDLSHGDNEVLDTNVQKSCQPVSFFIGVTDKPLVKHTDDEGIHGIGFLPDKKRDEGDLADVTTAMTSAEAKVGK